MLRHSGLNLECAHESSTPAETASSPEAKTTPQAAFGELTGEMYGLLLERVQE
jgi:hypothetical protein